MEELRKKVKALQPGTAFWIYCGVPVLLLVLFLVVPQWSMSATYKVISADGPEIEVTRVSGLNLLSGEVVFSRPSNVMTKDMTAGGGVALGVVYMLSLIGVVVLGFIQKKINYIYTLVPMVILFIMLAFGVNIAVKNDLPSCITGSTFGWIGFLIAVAWCAFAYIRGKESVSL